MTTTHVPATLSPQYYVSLVDHITFFLVLGILAAFWAFNFYYWDHSRPLLAVGPTGEILSVALAAFSVAATCVPPVISIGILSQVYLNGTVVWFHLLGFFVAVVVTAHIYLSVFFKCSVVSSFQYIGRRFGRVVRIIVAFLVVLQHVCFLPFVVITPALILKHAIRSEMWVVFVLILIILLPPTFCNSIRASAWNDCLTYIASVSLFIILIIIRVYSAGGFGFLWSNQNSNAFKFPSTSFDHTEAHTIWSLVIGSTVMWCSFMCFNPIIMDRCLAVKRVNQSKLAVWLSLILIGIIITLATVTGLIAYSVFSTCDPVTKFKDFHLESVIIYLLMDDQQTSYLLGPFIACMLAWTVGYIGFALYAMSNLAVVECLQPFLPHNGLSSIQCIHRSSMLVFVTIILGSLFAEPNFNNIFMLGVQIFTAFGGPLLGVFSLGLFVPWANREGAITGLVLGLVMSVWMTVGHIVYYPDDKATIPMSLAGCPVNDTTEVTTMTALASTMSLEKSIFDPMYKFSFLWIAPICSGIVILSGIFGSLFTLRKHKQVDANYLFPFVGYFVQLYRSKCQRDVEKFGNETSTSEPETGAIDETPPHTREQSPVEEPPRTAEPQQEIDVQQESTIEPEPETSTPAPPTIEPQPETSTQPPQPTIEPQPETTTSEPPKIEPEPETTISQSLTIEPQPETSTAQPSTIEPEPETSTSQSSTIDLETETAPRPESSTPQPEVVDENEPETPIAAENPTNQSTESETTN